MTFHLALLTLLFAAAPALASEKKVLAVLELRSKLKDADREQVDAAYLADQLRAAALKAIPDLRVMTRENLVVLLKSLGKDLASCEGECEVETGRKVGADLVLSGEVLKFGSRFKLSMRLHDTATGQLLSGSSASGKSADELDDATGKAIEELFRPLKSASCGDARDCAARCDLGEAASCRALAKSVDASGGLLRDAPRALKLYRRACDAGDAAGCFQAALKLASGSGAARSARQAHELFAKACSLGEQQACRRDPAEGCSEKLVRKDDAYANGEGCWFARACATGDAAGCAKECDAGHVESCYTLGQMYWDGNGVEKSLDLAAATWKRACDGGLALGCVHQGYATRPHDDRVIAVYERGCQLGSPSGCLDAGAQLWNQRKDYGAAVARWRLACDGGHPIACENLAALVHRDGVTAPKDLSKAAELFMAACDRGRAESCFELAALFEGPVLKDGARAAELFALACEWGDQRGCERAKH
jgi:TPR repeat protein